MSYSFHRSLNSELDAEFDSPTVCNLLSPMTFYFQLLILSSLIFMHIKPEDEVARLSLHHPVSEIGQDSAVHP